MFSHLNEVEMTRKYRKEHDLMGLEAGDLLDDGDGLTLDDIHQFIYPHDKEIEKVGVRGVYLSNYMRWDTKAQHEQMIERYGYETTDQQRTFDRYNDVDCFHYSGLHDLTKFIKWGYGKVTDHATREIRFGRLRREEGIALVRKYQEVEPADLQLFLEWIGMSKPELFAELDRHRDPRVWESSAQGWRLRDSILNHTHDRGVDEVRLPFCGGCDFALSPSRDPSATEDHYYLLRKGYVVNY